MTASLDLDRRQLLRAGLLGSAWLAGGAGVASLTGCTRQDGPAEGFLQLREADVELLSTLAPTVLDGALLNGDADIVRVLQRLDAILDSAAPGGRAALFQLYDVLQLGAFRWWVMDRWADPASLPAAERTEALGYWSRKQHSFARLAFVGLTQPLLMAAYTLPDIAKSTGYPGPPRKIVTDAAAMHEVAI